MIILTVTYNLSRISCVISRSTEFHMFISILVLWSDSFTTHQKTDDDHFAVRLWSKRSNFDGGCVSICFRIEFHSLFRQTNRNKMQKISFWWFLIRRNQIHFSRLDDLFWQTCFWCQNAKNQSKHQKGDCFSFHFQKIQRMHLIEIEKICKKKVP